jgi:poly(3-hydroxybutyrate) depolymerase
MRMSFARSMILGAMLTAIAAVPGAPSSAQSAGVNADRLPAGDASFTFSAWKGPALPVFTHLPAKVDATTPIVFVMHGLKRDAERYRREWAHLADANGFILVTPQYGDADFPGSRAYNHGGFATKDGRLRPRDEWTFASIEPIFDEVRRRTGSAVARYAIYGHSAGAQFVHRFVLLMPHPRVSVAVSANAGSYAFPTFDVAYPFGLKGAPVDRGQLKRAFATPMVVLLGTRDIDPHDKSLPTGAEAEAQGPYRYARGRAFFAAAQAAAGQMGTAFHWQVKDAPGVAHSDAGMAEFAAKFLGHGVGVQAVRVEGAVD